MDNWQLQEKEFPICAINHKETVFTIGNGYFSSRGSFEEGHPQENATTFIHGVYNDVPVFHTELVNIPAWFSLRIYFEDEEFTLSTGKILKYYRNLNMANGLLSRDVTWASPHGRQATFRFERFINMADVHHAAVRLFIEDIHFSGKIRIDAPIPGNVCNERYRHWVHVEQGFQDDGLTFLGLATMQTDIKVGITQAVKFTGSPENFCQKWDTKWIPTLSYSFQVNPGDTIQGEKHCAIFTSRESSDPLKMGVTSAPDYAQRGFDHQLSASSQVWDDLWNTSNVDIIGDDVADRALRYNIFQILVAAPRHDDKVSIGAKTLSGYGYRGHVFWDTEIFILPFLTFTQPNIARNLLMYRYHTLPGARAKAKAQGFQGAMFAWESAASGTEVTPKWVTGPDGELVRVWCGDIEQHITADVAYGIKQYWQATGDDAFMSSFGAEMVLSAAQFYASRLDLDLETKSFHIRNVIGPDEYHEHVDDNGFTNLMAKWVLGYGKQVADWLRGYSLNLYETIFSKLGLSEEVVNQWPDMAEKVILNSISDGVIEQFEGYFNLEYLDQSTLEPRTQSLQSLFGVEGVQKYQFIKQPDVVMALYLLRNLFTTEQIHKNMSFYTPRTDLSYGSSLGPSVQATMLARYGDVQNARQLFLSTLLTDLENNRGNTPDGIHAASAGAVWQVIVFGFAGFDILNGEFAIEPRLPNQWESIHFKIVWKGQKIPFDINR